MEKQNKVMKLITINKRAFKMLEEIMKDEEITGYSSIIHYLIVKEHKARYNNK